MSSYVLDASALMALFHQEPGSDKVEQAIEDGAAISTVNLSDAISCDLLTCLDFYGEACRPGVRACPSGWAGATRVRRVSAASSPAPPPPGARSTLPDPLHYAGWH